VSELDGKVAIVTGAGRGLGLAIATRFAEEGATVVVSDIDADAATVAAGKLPGGRGHAIACDVREEEQVRALVERTVADHGGLHVMVPNAGVASVGPLAEMDFATWRRVLAVNLDGVFLSMRYAAPAIIASGGGCMVALASVSATTGSPLIGHYSAAKAGVVNLAKTFATELRPHGVRVNAVLPGFIETDMVIDEKASFEGILGLPAGGFDGLIAQKQGRYGLPEEVVEAVLYFASGRSGFCTGSELILDGGLDASLL
jgi:NAD(P)-dependent dehydrogenase (short-subunit alcohol dehydrogenase family)